VLHPPPPTDELVVCAYNVERGLCLDAQLEAFTAARDFATPDVLLLSEADRGCSRTGDRNVAAEYAQALGMNYVYAVEFVELPRFWGPGGGAIRSECEHGNAIVSRYPLGNVRAIRHARSRNWNSRLQRTLRIGQPRLGGRVALVADARVGDRLVRCCAVHFESGRRRKGTENRDRYRTSQAREVIEDARSVGHAVMIGGDMNVVDYLGSLLGDSRQDPTTSAFLDDGYADAHSSLRPADRITSDSNVLLDLIFVRNLEVIDAGVGSSAEWANLSDHLPVWVRVRL
jgi:endonuclease/exonuclease/phosphatase family metal-dependent hydrolase